MNDTPAGRHVNCPQCGEKAIAIVPQGSSVVEREETADGKVWVVCRACGERFVVHFQTDRRRGNG